MPTYGVCCEPDVSRLAAEAGFDFAEAKARDLTEGTVGVGDYALPVETCNCLLDRATKLVGPDADAEAAAGWFDRVLATLAENDVELVVFGGGGSRNVPDGVDRAEAEHQLREAFTTFGTLCRRHGVTGVIEPLQQAECNIINTVPEAVGYVRHAASDRLRCLLDTYHFWTDDEPAANLAAAVGDIAHVHVADGRTRDLPGDSGASDYVELFGILKAGGYDGRISVEARLDPAHTADDYRRALGHLKRSWDAA